MDVGDIIISDTYDYILHEILEYEDYYRKLYMDIAHFIEDYILPEESSLNEEHLKQFLSQFLMKELAFEEMINIEKLIIADDIEDEFLDELIKEYNNYVSNKAIEIYSNLDKEQLIIRIINNINFDIKRKSR